MTDPPAAPPAVSARSDAELLRAHAAGEPYAFGELFHRHRDRLWAVALRTLADREEAADALQDALLSAHRAAARFRGDSAVTTWLHRIVVNSCLDRLRRRKAQPTVPLPDGTHPEERRDWGGAGPEPAAPAVDHDTVLVVRGALAELPTDQRTAIVLVDLQGYSVAEAAEILDVAEGTIKSRCARGRARLAVLLGHLRTGGEPAGSTPAGSPAAGIPAAGTAPAGTARARGGPARGGPPGGNPAPGGNPPPGGDVPSKSGTDRPTRGSGAGRAARDQAATRTAGPAAPEGGVQ